MADKAGDYMEKSGVKFMRTTVPTKVPGQACVLGGVVLLSRLVSQGVGFIYWSFPQVEQVSESPKVLKVYYKNTATGAEESCEFNTVSVQQGVWPNGRCGLIKEYSVIL